MSIENLVVKMKELEFIKDTLVNIINPLIENTLDKTIIQDANPKASSELNILSEKQRYNYLV